MTIRKQFNKPPLSIEEQIDLLQSRGMIINDRKLAAHYLEFVEYYRLSGYTHYFKADGTKYHKGTTFEAVLEHYIFDRKLRIILFDAIERIEVALRSVITSVMTSK